MKNESEEIKIEESIKKKKQQTLQTARSTTKKKLKKQVLLFYMGHPLGLKSKYQIILFINRRIRARKRYRNFRKVFLLRKRRRKRKCLF